LASLEPPDWGVLDAAAMPKLTLLALLAALTGCATLNPRVTYSGFGEADPVAEAGLLQKYRDSRADAPSEAAAKVKVLVDTIPEGIEFKDGHIAVSDGYKHRIIGKFSLTQGIGALYIGNFWFADYASGGRKALCYPQVVLTWVTLGLWMLVPTSYFCWGDIGNSKVELIDHVKKLTATAGGNVAVIGFVPGVDPEMSQGAGGIILEVDPESLKSDKLKKQSIPHDANQI
jgi:hypothetical protein